MYTITSTIKSDKKKKCNPVNGNSNDILKFQATISCQDLCFFHILFLTDVPLKSDLCALTKKINDNALSLIFQMANE